MGTIRFSVAEIPSFASSAIASGKAGNYAATFVVTDGALTIYDASTTTAIDVPTPASLTYNGTEQTGVTAAADAHYKVKDGATGTAAGTYTATVEADDGYVFPSGKTASVVWTIAPKAVKVTANAASKTFGAADPTLSASVDGTIGSDTVVYTVARVAGENAGTYDIVVSGDAAQGNYSVTFVGSKFTIKPLSIADGVVSGLSAKTYTGKAITQSPTLTVGGVALVANVDYQAVYANNTNVGEATIVFTGKGNYTGTVVAKFKINRKAGSITIKAKKKTFTAKYNVKTTIKRTKAFKVTKNLSKGKVTYFKKSGDKKIVIAKNGKITVKKGLKKKTYKVKVYAKSAAKGNYNAAQSKTITIKIKVK